MSSKQSSLIAPQCWLCVSYFDQLSSLLKAPERQSLFGISHTAVCDELGRFRIWAGNIGALQTIKLQSSLDYRLREAPKILRQIVQLLEDLSESLQDACTIASGERENQFADEVSATGNISSDEFQATSEIQELFESAVGTITSLFKLSVLIRSATSRDRYEKAINATQDRFDDSFDISHVGHKFGRVRRETPWLEKRLGKAITRRRQYLWYCREHRDKLALEPEEAKKEVWSAERKTAVSGVRDQQSSKDAKSYAVGSKPPSTLALTTASTLVPTNLDTVEEESDGDRSETSYATSVGDDSSSYKLRVPPPPEESDKGKHFECPYCRSIQTIKSLHSWRKHVLRDLRPYLCTFPECDLKMFPDRHTWFNHELQVHRVEWCCQFCTHAPYHSLAKFETHLRSLHAQKFNEAQLPALVELSQQSLDRIPATACPLCDDWEKKLREANPHTPKNEALVVTPAQFRRHVGAHMEQLALFAIPRGYKEDEDAGSSGAAPGIGTDDSSNKRSQASSRPDYEDQKNPPLHVAAFEGLEAKVLQLLEDGADINARGTTWGSAFAAAAAGGRGNIVELLLEKGVDVNAAAFSSGGTALQAAAGSSHLEVVERLLEKGADVNAAAAHDYGRTALQAAAEGGHLEVVDSSDRLALSRRLRESKKSLVGATFLRGIWLHANRLFTILTKAWRCDCQSFHQANLLLRHRTTSNVDFKVLLFFDQRKACPDPGPWTWQETDIKMFANKPRPTITAQTVPEKAALPSPKPEDGLRPAMSNETGRSSTSIASATSTTPSTKSSKAKKGVAWAVPDPQPAPPPPQSPQNEDVNMNEITDLCTAIACSSHSLSCLGFLNHEDHRYCVYPVMKQQASWDTRETVTLESLLMRSASDQPWTPCTILSRQERYFIALTLASSLLQLHATPWLATQWSKKDILFLRNGPDSIVVDQPYVSPQPSSQPPTYYDTSKSISALGIMLLELCFGIALEDHDIRRGFLGADSQPNPALDLVAAKEWCERYAEGEAGQDFADAIGWCLRNKTGRKSTDVKDEGWKDALFTEVVKPLQHCHDLMTVKSTA